MRQRSMQLKDENGQVPESALIRAVERMREMRPDSQIWASAGASKKPGETDENGMPLTAGVGPGDWTWLGPGNIGGRIRSILIHPTSPSTMWVGSVTGGIWKTTNGGASWAPVNDFMANLAVTSLVMDPFNPNIIYAGTGEDLSSGVGQDAGRGAGVFKTTNGGLTWTQLPATATPAWHFVNRLTISPTNGQVLLAATNSGLWRSSDGGASWSQRTSRRELDVEFHPFDGNRCVTSRSGAAAFSFDGGFTWQDAFNFIADRVEVTYSRSNPSLVYASMNFDGGRVLLSQDGGQTYSFRTQFKYDYLMNQGDYDNVIWADPVFPNIVIVGGIDLWLSNDFGATFTRISDWRNAPRSAHADQHFIVAHPGFNGTSNRTVFFGNDGGIYKTSDLAFATTDSGWTELNNNLGITQFYSVAGNVSTGTIVGGTQDNGSLRYTLAGGTEGHREWFSGDGGYSAADPTDSRYFYGEYVNLDIFRSSDGANTAEPISGEFWDGSAFHWKAAPFVIPDARDSALNRTRMANFIAPFILDPNNANRILAGGRSLWRTNDAKTPNTNFSGPQWAQIKPPTGFLEENNISAIAVAPGNSNIIWVGHNNGDVYFTTNGTAATPTWFRADLGMPSLPNRYCMRIAIDPTNSSRVYVTFGGFSADNVWRTTNGGQTWTDVSGNLPSVPVRTIAVLRQNPNWLYVGTEIGVFATADGGLNWSPTNDGPTNCSVDELIWMGDTLVAATHGRGLWRTRVRTVNNPPTVAITSPPNGAVFNSPANISVTATAGDADGTISKVEFFSGAVSLGQDTAAPYGVAWNGVAPGTYALTAKATDNLGAVTTSSAVVVTVRQPTGGVEELMTDDGTLELGGLADGAVVVNRLTPTRYPATVQTIRIYFAQYTGLTSPTGAPIRLVVFSGPGGGSPPPNNPLPLLSKTVTIPSINPSGDFVDFNLAANERPIIFGGDLYVGFQTPNPAGGVVFPGDTNGLQRGRAYFSTDNGLTYNGLALRNSDGTIIPINLMVRAVVSTSSCTFSISPTARTHGPGGELGSVAVSTQSGCSYAVVNNNPSFLTVTSGGSGTGGGTVNYSVAANTGTAQRTGSLSIAGQTFTVTQNGSSTATSTFDFGSATYGGAEGAGQVVVSVLRSGNTSAAAAVDYFTTNGTATDVSDYSAVFGKLRFAPGETSKSFSVFVNDDVFAEPTESFGVALANPTVGTLGLRSSAAVTLTSDDVSDGFSPVGPLAFNSAFYVSQHYVDFFNRAADPAGLAFWKNQIDACGTQTACRQDRLVNVSAAFFLSIEFQETGFLAYRTHRAAFNLGPTLRRNDFLPDQRALSAGVVIGQPGALEQLEANKRAYFSAFVNRAAFLSRYPLTMTAAQFVDALNANTTDPRNPSSVGSLSLAERNALVAALGAGSITRAQALRAVAEDADLAAREKNRAFVLMQYFGYMRRNPNDPPELTRDFQGYNFWLKKLNDHGGDFVSAEMVKSFITSGEYISRFGL